MRQEGDSCNAVIGVFYASMIDVARCGAVRCGAVRCGVAWRGVAWRGWVPVTVESYSLASCSEGNSSPTGARVHRVLKGWTVDGGHLPRL